MDIIKITPQGFCKGVINAINIINDALEKNDLPKPIYMLGHLVHNDFITNAYLEQGIIILDGKPRIDLLEDITSGTVIITAHGVGDAVIKKAQNRGLYIINATCKDVYKTHEVIKENLLMGKTCFYYGKRNHPETEGVLLISDDIILIEDGYNLDDLPNNKGDIILTNQTTMSYLDVIKLHQELLIKYPQIKLINEICNATRFRQEAVIKMGKNSDLCLVVGDKKSHNTEKLVQTAKTYTNAECIKIETIEDLNNIDLDIYQTISITAGASTPKAIVDEIIFGLKSYPALKKPFKTSLKGSDYLKYK